jgi:hypothetical protein
VTGRAVLEIDETIDGVRREGLLKPGKVVDIEMRVGQQCGLGGAHPVQNRGPVRRARQDLRAVAHGPAEAPR